MADIAFPAGTTQQIEFSITYASDWSVVAKQGNAVAAADISSARFLLKTELDHADSDALIEKTDSDGITLVDGKATVAFDPADTVDFDGTYYGTLRLYLDSGSVQDFETSEGLPYVTIQITQGAVDAVS